MPDIVSIASFLTDTFSKKAAKIPKPKLLSSCVTLSILQGDCTEVELGDIDSFSAKKRIKTRKQFLPFGSNIMVTQTEDDGWDIEFSVSKTDPLFAYFMSLCEETSIEKGESPVFHITKTYDYAGGFSEQYVFFFVVILNYEETIPENNEPIQLTFSAFSPRRQYMGDISKTQTKIKGSVETMLDVIKDFS